MLRVTGASMIAALMVALGGSAHGQFTKQGVRLHSNIPLSAFPGAPTSGSGGSGYVSPSGREYACFGVRNGVNVVDITNLAAPVQVGYVAGPASTWHESAVVGDYLYFVADGVNQGMHIIDLRLADQGFISLVGTYTGNNLQRVHTLQGNPGTNYLYLNGTNIQSGGLVVLDVTNPTNPVQVGAWNTRYVHDCQIVTYTSGPYAGREIAFLCCGGGGLYVVDITNKANMVTLDSLDYLVGSNYCHSGVLTADGKYFLVNDETDENNSLVPSCTTHIIDVRNLSDIVYVGPYTNGGNYIDHNSQRVQDWLHLAAYRGGLRIYNIAAAPTIVETGYFDTYPGGGYSYTGAWGVQSGYPSGNIAVFDINRGLFVLDPQEAMGEGAPIIGTQVIAGQYLAGGTRELRRNDGLEFMARWAEDPKFEDTPVVSLLVAAATDYSPAVTLDLSVKVRIDGATTGLGAVKALNRVTNNYDLLGTFPITTAASTWSRTGLTGSTYVASNGRMDLELDVYPGIEAEIAAFSVFVDQVKFTVRRS